MQVKDLTECPKIGLRVWNSQKTRKGTVTELYPNERIRIVWDETKNVFDWWWKDTEFEVCNDED